jgi:hypothetical protein
MFCKHNIHKILNFDNFWSPDADLHGGELLSSLLQVKVYVTYNLPNVLVQIANKMGFKKKLTSCSRLLYEVVTHLVKKFTTLYETHKDFLPCPQEYEKYKYNGKNGYRIIKNVLIEFNSSVNNCLYIKITLSFCSNITIYICNKVSSVGSNKLHRDL